MSEKKEEQSFLSSNLALPGNPRYQPKDLIEYFGYDNLFREVAAVEMADLDVLAEIGVISNEEYLLLTPEVRKAILAIPTSEVDRVERDLTHHDVRAWIRLAQSLLPLVLRRWAHIPLTSYDPLDTGRTIQFTKAHQDVVRPKVKRLMAIFIVLIRRYACVLQIGRTHGQHALPITVGFWLATILSRILYNVRQMDLAAEQLCGKISGAVGCHNAQICLGLAKRCGEKSFEERVLEKLGLKPAPISTQILPPEPLAYYLFSAVMLSAAFGQFGRDGRNLMRSEIAEVAESFEEGQVGSSTMAQKRNPINFENLEGTWIKTKNEFGKVLDTLISDHQRDLVGSPVARDFPIIIVNLTHQMSTLLRENKNHVSFLSRVMINEDRCRANFEMSQEVILAEPLYIAMQMAGYQGDAHELVNRQAVPKSQVSGKFLIEVIEEMALEDPEIKSALENIPDELIGLFHHPENYTGDASEQALKIADLAEQYITD
ncbi:MAG: lyase family protein [Patescibacteria group bacterium]